MMRTGASWVHYEPGSPHPFLREPPELPGDVATERAPNVCALADVPEQRERHGRTDLRARALADRLGAGRTAMQHVRVADGAESWPPHCHSAEEELFVVLDGAGSLVLGDERVPLRRGSCVARPPGTRVAHQFVGPLTLLAWSTHEPDDIVFYPRSQKVYIRGAGVRFRVEPAGYWDGEPG